MGVLFLFGAATIAHCWIGTRIAAHLEALASDSGAERIEIGVFEYNEPALRVFILNLSE
jgi:hypothetical protein